MLDLTYRGVVGPVNSHDIEKLIDQQVHYVASNYLVQDMYNLDDTHKKIRVYSSICPLSFEFVNP
jgi:hypothetical protein